jgi:hypothetical protein
MWYLFFSPRQTVLARRILRTFFSSGSCSVRARSRTSILVGSSLAAGAADHVISGNRVVAAMAIRAALALTLSMASTT